MKKAYINPQIAIIRIATFQMLATSNTSLNLNIDEEEDDVTKLLSREFDY
jgi:hypothetical protein